MGIFSDVLLTVDFDRTLTGPDGLIPQRNLTAIEYFMENGGRFTVNSGRSVMTYAPYFDTLPVNAPQLLYNGSAACQDGKLVNVHAIDLDMWQTIDKIRSALPELNLEIQGQDPVHYLVDETPEFVAFYEGVGWKHAPACREKDMGPFMKLALFGVPHANVLSDMFECTPEEEAYFVQAEKTVQEICEGKVETFRAAPRIIDVQPKGVSKIRAARELQAQLGSKILVCVGDAENDIPMLDGADYSFCPADGVVADRYQTVCKCGDGAIADVIYKKIPEILGITLDNPEIV